MGERYERLKEFAEMHAKARVKAGKSQEFMAMELGVSKKTVQNWEKGISQPDFFQSLEWFRVLGTNPFPIYLEFYYRRPNDKPSEEDVEKEWQQLTGILPNYIKRAVLFILFGRHGSSPFSLVQLALAHVHSPLKSRVVNATIIRHNYEMAEAQNELICKDNIMPDLDMLDGAIVQGKESAINNDFGYVIE